MALRTIDTKRAGVIRSASPLRATVGTEIADREVESRRVAERKPAMIFGNIGMGREKPNAGRREPFRESSEPKRSES